MEIYSIFDTSDLSVVVDTDESILRFLTLKAKSRQIYKTGKVITYNGPETFLRDVVTDKFPAGTHFYFGTFYGVGCKTTGADLARAAKGKNKKSPVFIVTTEMKAHKIVDAKAEGIIDAIFPKELYYSEPHNTGQFTDDENKEFSELSELLVPVSSISRILNFKSKERERYLQEILKSKRQLEAIESGAETGSGSSILVRLIAKLKIFRPQRSKE